MANNTHEPGFVYFIYAGVAIGTITYGFSYFVRNYHLLCEVLSNNVSKLGLSREKTEFNSIEQIEVQMEQMESYVSHLQVAANEIWARIDVGRSLTAQEILDARILIDDLQGIIDSFNLVYGAFYPILNFIREEYGEGELLNKFTNYYENVLKNPLDELYVLKEYLEGLVTLMPPDCPFM